MKKLLTLSLLLILALPALSFAGFTETLPKNAFMLDIGYIMSRLDSKWDNDGKRVPLIEPIEQYEPGAGLKGVLKPDPLAEMGILVPILQYGFTDSITAGVGLPIFLYTKIDPRFGWEKGDYQWSLGRQYSLEDFWQWAESMGQPRLEKWEGNHGKLADMILAFRWRFTDKLESFARHDLAMALYLQASLPTGEQGDPEEVITAGTTTWDLHASGDLAFHLALDKMFNESLDGRLTLGWELFYEIMLPHSYTSSTGEKNPLLLNYQPYTGTHYTIDGGDFSGASMQVDVVPWKGPALGTWITDGDASKAEKFPPLLSLSFRYTFTHLQQTNWESDSDIWDYEREKEWMPGYKNILWGQGTVSLLRVGAPVMLYGAYRNLTWIPGKNARAVDIMQFGVRILMQFW